MGDIGTRTLDAVNETPGSAVAAAAPTPVSDAGRLNVFISYSRDDISFADQLDATLQIGGFATTVDRHGIDGGEHWKTRLGALIRDADTVAFVLTPHSARSPICDWEVEEAIRLNKRILPVLPGPLEGARPPPGLAELNYILFYVGTQETWIGLRTRFNRTGRCP